MNNYNTQSQALARNSRCETKTALVLHLAGERLVEQPCTVTQHCEQGGSAKRLASNIGTCKTLQILYKSASNIQAWSHFEQLPRRTYDGPLKSEPQNAQQCAQRSNTSGLMAEPVSEVVVLKVAINVQPSPCEPWHETTIQIASSAGCPHPASSTSYSQWTRNCSSNM